MARPSPEDVREVTDTIRTAEDYEYFFDSLNSPDWIEPLAEAGYFASPPSPVQSDDGVQFFGWAASRYLARMAGIDPDAVCKVVRSIPATENVRVLHDLADVSLSLPPDMAAEFVPVFISWLNTPFQILLPRKATALIRRLSLAGQEEPALQLAAALFRVCGPDAESSSGEVTEFPSPMVTYLKSYEYEELISECRTDLIAGTGQSGFSLLMDLLQTVVELDVAEPDGSWRDLSWVWRRAVEPNDQNGVPSVNSTLVSVVRDAALQISSANRQQLANTVDLLEARKWTVFRRIALDVLRERAPTRSAAVSKHLLDTANLHSNELHHEYWMLLRERFSTLTEPQKQRLLKAIEVGSPIFRDPDGPYGDDGPIALEVWQVRFLAAIADDLADELRAWLDGLIAKRRLSEHPEFLMFTSGMWVGPTSPKTDAEVAGMSDDELLAFLDSWQPEQDLMSPSAEGLARMLTTAVRADPARFADQAVRFRTLSPTYINGILSGLREVAAAQEAFSWESALSLMAWVTGRDRTVADGTTEFSDVDPAWGWAKMTVAHLLDVGLNGGRAEIPYELRPLVWSVLRPLTDDPYPSIEEEAQYGGSNMDPSTLAINTVRGQALQSVVKYALWVHRHQETPLGFDQMPEVREILESHLRLDDEPSYAVHSMYGRWFPWIQLIDPEWATVKVPSIFPADEDQALYWEAAWEAYISFCQPFDSVLDALRGEYGRAIERIESVSTERQHPLLTFERLVQHLMLFYMRGRLALDNEIIVEFFRTAPPELRGSAVRFVGRNFYQIVGSSEVVPLVPPPASEVVARGLALWESRALGAEEGDTGRALEMSEFGWWFPAPSFDPSWALDQLVTALHITPRVDASHLVMARLAQLASTYPDKVLEAFQLMLDGDYIDWVVLGESGPAMDILRTLLVSRGSSIRRRAEELTNLLGARGYRQFRELLTPSADSEPS